MESLVAGRRRTATRHSAEDQALDQIAKENVHLNMDSSECNESDKDSVNVAPENDYQENEDVDDMYDIGELVRDADEAEARLAARRQARAEAREIRMRELERQQKEAEENADRVYDMCTADANRSMRVTPDPVRTSRILTNSNNFQSSRRSSEDSLEDAGLSRDLRLELKEFEEKFRKAMITNAQLDNEKSTYSYQVDLLKDKLEELEETTAQLRRELREKNREAEQLKRVSQRLKEDLDVCRVQLLERDTLIQENGLVIVEDERDEDDAEMSNVPENGPCPRKRVLVSMESAEALQNAGEGSLDVRLRKFACEKKELQDEIRHLRLELEDAKNRVRSERSPGSMLGHLTDSEDIQREANKHLADYKFKLQKAEQDMSTLQATVARLESQVIRYKSAAEASEKAEDELKVEKRKLQREVRESQGRVEELETANSHLQRRLDKLKNAKSALLKEL